jgi:hypothetical protein
MAPRQATEWVKTRVRTVPAENAGNGQRGMRMQMQRLGRSKAARLRAFLPVRERRRRGGEEWEEWEE